MALVIFTERLELMPLLPGLLEAIARGDASAVARRLDAAVPGGWTDTIPARERLEQLAADPSEQPWLVRAIVLRAPQVVERSSPRRSIPLDLFRHAAFIRMLANAGAFARRDIRETPHAVSEGGVGSACRGELIPSKTELRERTR
jgi:hypothetical protein